jgi:hypothetical protein
VIRRLREAKVLAAFSPLVSAIIQQFGEEDMAKFDDQLIYKYYMVSRAD